MKHLNFLSNLLSLSLGSPCTDVSLDRRLTVGSPSGLDAKWKQNPFMRFAVVLTLIFTIGSGNVWGDTYTITFKTAAGDPSSPISTSTAINTIVSDGASYVKSLNTCTKCYGPAISGLKLGTGSATGTFKFTLSDDLAGKTIKSVTIKNVKYGSDSGNITGTATGTNTGALGTVGKGTDLVKDYGSSSKTKITTIQVATSSKRAYISKIIIETIEEAPSCSNSVALSKGSATNGTVNTISSASVATCSSTESDRRVTITITPDDCYDAPSTLTWTKSSGTVSASKQSGPTDNGNGTYSYVYQFAQNNNGAGTFGVTCTAKAAGKTVNFDAGPGVSASSSLTETCSGSGVTLPAVTATGVCKGWTTFAGWATAPVTDSTTTSGVTLYAAGSNYVPASNNMTLYAVYSKTKGGGSGTLKIVPDTYTNKGTNTYGSGAERTGTVGTIDLGAHYVTGNNSGTPGGSTTGQFLQCQGNNANIYNKTALPGKITQVVLNQNSATAFSLYCGTEQLMASNNTSTGQTPSGTAQTAQSAATQMTWTVSGNYTYFDIKKGSSAGYITSIVITYGSSTTYYCSDPDCCTPLGSINGSVSFSNVSPTSVTVGVPSDYVDKANANLEGYIFKRYTASTGGSAVETIETNSSSGTTATFSDGLVANTEYFYTIIAKHSSSSCNSEETSPRKSYTITSYTVSYANGGGSGTNPGAHSPVLSGTSVTLKANTFTAPAGKQFAGWNDGSNDYNAGVSYSVTGNKTMTAQWSCITPSISGHPLSASYTQGASPANLSVTASGGTLSYQWKQCATIDGTYENVASGGTSSTYSPSTASVGTIYYKCVVTNTGSSCNTTATSNAATITISAASQCVAPTFSVAAGTYNSAQTVTISSTTPGSTIYYTTNGDEPTTSSSHGTEGEASASVTVSSSLTLKAIAYKGGMTNSDVSDATYVICSTDPSFSTTSSSNITITGARVTCAGITKGTCDIDAYGIVYGTSEHPTGNAQEKGTDASTNVSSYYVDLTGLTAATTYYARPYATVNGKTVYGTEISFTTLHIPEITVSVTSRAFGTKKVDGSYEMSFTVEGLYLQGNIGLAISGTNEAMFSVDKTSLTPSTGTVGSTTVTVTYTPSGAGSHSATVSITSTNATTKTVTLSGTGQYEDTYMTAMHEGVTAWTSYATGVTKAGTGYEVPNPGDIEAGDREGTGCEGIHYHFAGWVEESYKASPSGHIIDASGTEDANNKTYWAVWEKEAAGGASSSTSITSYEDGDYYIVDTRAEVVGGFFALNGAVSSDAIAVTDIRSAVTENALTRTITINLEDAVMDDAMQYRLTTVGDSITIQHISSSSTVSQKTNDTKFETTGTRNWIINKHATDNRFTIQSWFTKSGDNKTSCLLMQYSNWVTDKQVLTLTARPFNAVNMGGTAAKAQNYMSGYVYLVPAISISYDDPKVECICSSTPSAGTAAVDAEGTFSASSIAVKATGASTGHADCSYTDYGFVWSSSETTPTLVEGTGAASTNCTKVQVGTSGEVTSFTGSITTVSPFSANNAIYFRSYAKNGKADGTYQYSDVVTITPRSVTFNLNGHGSSAPATQLVNNGSKATDPSYSESVTGYIFGGWYKEEGCSNAWNFATDVVSGESKTLYAKWTPISYSVRFNNNDANYLGTATGSMSDQSFDYDESKALTANGFSLAGYDFAGWALTPTGDVAYTDGASASNLSSTNGATVDLYAIWSPKSYDVTLAATDETSSIGEQVVTATYNAAMPTTKKGGGDVVAPSRTGYTFTGWEYNSTTYYNYDASTSTLSSAHVWDQPNSTTTLTPKWSINSYTLRWDLAGGTVSVAGTGAAEGATGTPSSSVVYNSAITEPTVTRAGYNFAGWNVTPASTMPASNVTYTATWTPKTLNSISLAEASVSVYVGEIKYVNVIFDPTDILSKAFTQSVTPIYCLLTSYDSYNKIKITGGKAGADISVNRTETVGIKYTADETKTASISVTVKPLPTVTFVDLIHNKSDFANSGDGWTAGTGVLSSTVTTGVVSHAKKTPTHTDVPAPVGGNACETGHLHLMGWIRSDYSKVADYMNGTGAAPTVSELTSAGTGYWFLPDADINTETYNGKTFYAVWAVEE